METVVTLLVAGTILLLLETVLPGMIAGIVGFGCLVGGVVMAYSQFGPVTGNLTLLGVTIGLVATTLLWLRFFPKSPFARVFVTRGQVGELGAERPELLHQTGAALTNLRPSGTALIRGKRVDVVTEGALIERGSSVKVVAIEGLRVVVRAV